MRRISALLAVITICGCAGKPASVRKVSQARPVPAVKPVTVFNPGTQTVGTASSYKRVDPLTSIPLIPLETAPTVLDPDKTKVSGSVSVSAGYDKVNSRVDRIGRAPATADSAR